MRVSPQMKMQELAFIFGDFKACVGGREVLWRNDDRVYDVLDYKEVLYVLPFITLVPANEGIPVLPSS